MTPLHLAAKFGHLSVLDALKELVSLKVYSVKVNWGYKHSVANCIVTCWVAKCFSMAEYWCAHTKLISSDSTSKLLAEQFSGYAVSMDILSRERIHAYKVGSCLFNTVHSIFAVTCGCWREESPT